MNPIPTIGLSLISLVSVVLLYSICQVCVKLARDTEKMRIGVLYNDGVTPHYHITGNKHRNFELDTIDNTIAYAEWFCGHYHIDKEIDKTTMLGHNIRPLYTEK